jgi:hypothetical protein
VVITSGRLVFSRKRFGNKEIKIQARWESREKKDNGKIMKIKMKVLDSFRIFGWVGNLLRLLSAHVFVASLELYTMLGG